MTEICYFCKKPIEGMMVTSKYTGMCYHSKCHNAYNKDEGNRRQKKIER